jgi:hypothetical protein
VSGSDLPPVPPSSRARRVHEAENRRSTRAVLSASDIAGIVVLGVVGLAVAAILAVVIAGNLFERDPPGAAAGGSPSPTASRSVSASARAKPTPTSTTADTPWTGRIRAAPIASARASCGQHDLRTTTGRIAQFQGPQAIDGAARTAWRCAGDGVGRTLRVKLVAPGRIAAVGLVPGFAATDPITGKDGFTTDRRVTRVQWSLGGRIVDQTLVITKEKLQLLRIPPTLAGSITLTILATAPAEEDVFAVSDIGVYAVRG